MRAQRIVLWIAVSSMLALLAGVQPIAPKAARQETPAPTVAIETPDAPPTFGPGSFSLQPLVGLADLSSYQATLKIAFRGNTGGKPDSWNGMLELLTSQNPPARSLKATFKGNVPIAAHVATWSATMNGLFYRQTPDRVCIASDLLTNTDPNISNTQSPVWEPADFLPGVIGAEESSAKTVNGVAAKGYKFDERALGVAGRATAVGEVWVAEAGGYVVKYSLTLKGGADYFGEGSDGTLTWNYDVTKANQPIAIVLQKGCPSGLVNAPVLDDAQDVVRLPGITMFLTPSTVAQVADFYQNELPAVGWKMEGKPSIGEKSGIVKFKQSKSTLTVIITVGDKGTVVRLLAFTQ